MLTPCAGGEQPWPKLKRRRSSTDISLHWLVGQPSHYREADRKYEDAEDHHREYARGQTFRSRNSGLYRKRRQHTMTVRAMAPQNGMPALSGPAGIRPDTGPARMPAATSQTTSGMRVRAKMNSPSAPQQQDTGNLNHQLDIRIHFFPRPQGPGGSNAVRAGRNSAKVIAALISTLASCLAASKLGR